MHGRLAAALCGAAIKLFQGSCWCAKNVEGMLPSLRDCPPLCSLLQGKKKKGPAMAPAFQAADDDDVDELRDILTK